MTTETTNSLGDIGKGEIFVEAKEPVDQPTGKGSDNDTSTTTDPPSTDPDPPEPGLKPIGGKPICSLLCRLAFVGLMVAFFFNRDPDSQIQSMVPETPIEDYEHFYKVHTVKKGESLSLIAGMYGVGIDEMIRMNGIKEKNHINVGMKIKIPRP